MCELFESWVVGHPKKKLKEQRIKQTTTFGALPWGKSKRKTTNNNKFNLEAQEAEESSMMGY